MKFIIFLILSLELFTQDNNQKLLDYIKYLSQKRIIENVYINPKDFLNNEDFILTLYKLLKSIDKSKVSKEDIHIIENILFLSPL